MLNTILSIITTESLQMHKSRFYGHTGSLIVLKSDEQGHLFQKVAIGQPK